MVRFDNKLDLSTHLESISTAKTTIGFVPTMGALHDGHLSLLQTSINNNNFTVISIFVNPTQFNNEDDLKKYPRNLEDDIDKIKTISNEIILFAPSVNDIYGETTYHKSFEFDGIDLPMEGSFRPGHYNGVATVVSLLFSIVKPTNAYFGEKDFQQLQIIRKIVEKLDLNINIICCPIFREVNGLAMSSRNARLNSEQKDEAGVIYEILQKVKTMFGEEQSSIKKINSWVSKKLSKHKDITLEYFEIANEKTLISCKRKSKNMHFRAFIAVYINNVRLIDTISLK